MMGWLIGGVLCMIVLMTALCVVSGDADERRKPHIGTFLRAGGAKHEARSTRPVDTGSADNRA